ncbi:MAG: amidohydrolase family protein [Deltaproteobacteria bacterium]
MTRRKSEQEPELRSPIPFDPPSNGEFCPRPPSARARLAERLWRRLVEDQHRRLGLSRRQFVESACGMASALWAINQAACGDGGSDAERGYAIDDGMLEDEERARVVLSGNEFIFDVQTHVSDPLTPFESNAPPERVLDFIRQIFVQSDTTMACVTGTPEVRSLGADGVQGNRLLSELIDRLAGPRLILHANANPENGPAELDYLSAIAAEYPVSAWKLYPHTGNLGFDSEELGAPFVERARSLGVKLIAAHRGISNNGGYASAGSPRDIVRAAQAAPDVRFLVYHSGWESRYDENHPYDAAEPDPHGVDRFIRALRETGLGPNDNVYAELGSTWFNLMAEPEQAAHVLGKLLTYLGPERIVWGTDCVFNGDPQSQIVAFRAFQIPESLQQQFGYPALTAETKARIFGLNGADVYGVDPAQVRYVIAGDEVNRLRSARLDDPRSVPLPDPRRYEGPRTRAQFLALLRREEHENTRARAPFRG